VIVITLFPDLFPGPLDASLIGTARASAIWSLDTIDLRTHGLGRHRAVDDTPAGGGAGMVLRPDVMAAAIDQARTMHPSLPLIYLSPRGMPFTQTRARALAAGPGAILIAGRFEGLDQRVIDACTIEEISVGDYVLSGGELPAMILIDACVRLLPGVLGGAESLTEESFESGLLEYPQYTKPRDWQGHPTPDVLLSGDHAKISAWRREQAENLTRMRRPDLFIPVRKPPKR
jgi:tRNA (guanine37-N1)-methyltransferase